VGSRKRLRRLWQPSGETLEAIAAILGEHWRSATAHPEALLWARSVSWLSSPARGPAPSAPDHHLTSGGKLIR